MKDKRFPSIIKAILLSILIASCPLMQAAESAATGKPIEVDYMDPKVLTGTIYADDSMSKVLFTFRRSATNVGSAIHVSREFRLPGGTLAATEQVVYESSQLVSYELNELSSGAKGSTVIKVDPKKPKERNIIFKYTDGGATRTDTEKLQPDTLINDTVASFIRAHWHSLTNGSTVKLRMVALARTETVGFKMVKESETTVKGKPVVILRMDAASVFIAPFIEPLRFTVEKDGAHRVLQYSGRTTPRLQKNGRWHDLDALTVFDWK